MALAMLTVVSVLKLGWDAQFYDDYYPDAALNAVIRDTQERTEFRWIDFTFEGVPGHPVPTVMAMPKSGAGPFPVLIFLHGIGQQKGFLDRIATPFVNEGYAIVCFDQLLQGERDMSDENYLAQARAFRLRAAWTVIETRRLIDYLETRPDIDTNRLFLLGASYGTITGSTASAFDERIKGTLLCYGGGDIAKLIDSEMVAEVVGPAMPLLQTIGSWYLAPADPVRYVHKISPRPVLFQNGKYDRLVPPPSSQALIDAAGEPKDVIWYNSDHIGFDEDHVVTVLDDAMKWIKAHDQN